MLMRRCPLVQDAKHLRCYPLPDQRVEVVGHRGLHLAAANHCKQPNPAIKNDLGSAQKLSPDSGKYELRTHVHLQLLPTHWPSHHRK